MKSTAAAKADHPGKSGTVRSAVGGAALIAALVAGTAGAAAQEPAAGSAAAEADVIAHRGASADAPENTLPAVRLGARVKSDFVEIDVQRSSDGHLVVIHDTTLARTTDVEDRYPTRAPYNVSDFTLEEIRTLDAGSWFSPGFAGTGIPTLSEVLDALNGRAGLLLEVKSPALYPGIAADLAAELDQRGWLAANGNADRLIVQSFDWGFMKSFHDLAPNVPAGLLGGPPSAEQMAELSSWADQINPSHTRVTAGFVEAVHRYGMETYPYTVDDSGRMRELLALGVDGIITNRPADLLDVLRQSPRPDSAG